MNKEIYKSVSAVTPHSTHTRNCFMRCRSVTTSASGWFVLPDVGSTASSVVIKARAPPSLIYVPRHGSLFDAVHAVVGGHYDIIYRGTVLVTRRMTPVGLGMSMYEVNQVVIRYDSVIDYSTMSDNTDSEEDAM